MSGAVIAAARTSGWFRDWVAAEQTRFTPWIAVLIGAGVLLYFALHQEPPAWAGITAVGLGVAACAAGWRSLGGRALGIALLAVASGFLAGQAATWRAQPIEALPRQAVIVTARINAVEALPEGRRIELGDVQTAPDALPLARTFRLRLGLDDDTPLAAGDRVRARVLLHPPMPPAYPGAWDVQRDAFFAGQGGSARALGDVGVIEQAGPSGGLARWWQGVRERVGERVRAGLPGAVGAIAATLLTGEQAAIPAADRAAFRDSGLAHILAVAGLHIGIVMALAFGLARRALALSEWASLHWPCKSLAAVASLAVGALYVALTGGHVPTLRSFAMAALVTLGLAAGRRALSMHGLALAAMLILLASPNALLGVSFQMSFSAVAALIAGYEAMRPWLARLHGAGWGCWLARHMAALALTSLLAGGASTAFASYHFGHVQLYFVVANMAAVPITATLAMPMGLAALALMPLGLERLALAPMGWGVEAILWIGRTVSSWPAATLPVAHLPGWGLAVFALGLAWLCLWRTRPRLLGICAMAAGLLSPLAAPPPDILVSSDARLIGVGGANLLVQPARGGSGFMLDAWRAYLEAGPPRPLEDGAACDANACRVEREGAAALILRPHAAAPDCAGATVVISPEPLRGACKDVPSVDRFSVWRDGAHAIWLRAGEARIVSDREWRGERPWVPLCGQQARPNLPMALPDVPLSGT